MFNKTVASITKVFTQAIKDLETLVNAEDAKININYEKQAKIAAEIQASQVEIKHAQDVRAKLLSIVQQ